ncbi:hypothetical protein CCM_07984 [Cordyceps militaris CM01]|uniref:F-box domain-containing protein n=1 Tax=Cordyceps militaris (strain CM01) TaxID=983644 RepID=G3JPC2_CORMM|nr:uncharacterized protein CCM_07984 [Cordyceps militaris CM01]EGX89732.1 hypothetical protein CCM_07984 [Cordyceps militaris CM01]
MDESTAYTHGSPLLRLPLELLLRVSHHLTTIELGNLRLSCRHVESSLFHSFAREFFLHKQFNLTEFSLKALVAVSRSRMAPHLRFLHIGLETVSHASMCQTQRSTAHTHRHNRLHAENWILSATGQDVVLLAEALRGLVNLEDVVLRDTNSSRRSRDGHGATWRSYGDATFRQQTGTLLSNAMALRDDEFASYRVLIKTLQALAAADANVGGIELLLRRHGVPWRGTFYIPEYLVPTVRPVLAKLTKLHLVIGDNYRARPNVDSFDAETWSFDLRTFLSYVPNLRDFRFNGQGGNTVVFARFLEWLSLDAGSAAPPPAGVTNSEETAIIQAGPPPVGFPQLTRFSLGRIYVQPPLLVRLLRKFAPTLEDLALWEVTLCVDDEQELVAWRGLWQELRGLGGLDKLRRLKVGRQTFDDVQVIRSRPVTARFRDGGGEVEYIGSDWRAFARETLESAEITRIVQDEDSQDNEDSSDDD